MTNAPARKVQAPATIQQLLEGEAFRKQLKRALPKHLSSDRFLRVVLTTMTRTPKLAQCDQASFFNALLTLSQIGLEPDGRRAHLIPFENRKKGITECQLIVDYKGIVELIYDADGTRVHADVVCENDVFVYDRGILMKHEIDFKKPRGAIYAAYTLFRFKDGNEKAEVMSKEEIDKIRARSRAADSGPWVTDWNEMAKKTTLRRGSKWVKLSPEQRDVIERDDTQFDTDTFEIPPSKESTVREAEPETNSAAPVYAEARPSMKFKQLLSEVCEGDFMTMEATLKTVTYKDGKWLTIKDVDNLSVEEATKLLEDLKQRTKR